MSTDGRPLSRRSSTSQPCRALDAETSKKLQYEPHLFDLVYASKNVDDCFLNVDLPVSYLEAAAVDSARILGHGASFTASVRTLPPGPEVINHKVVMDGWTATQVLKAPPRPKFVVYKTARVAFDTAGDALPGYRAALQSVLTELHALTYPPLFRHPNIISFLGLAWGTNEFQPSHRLPALVVEYAEHGTMADVLAKRSIHPVLAQSLCFDFADALAAVHQAGLVHGDIKAENVLVCQGQERMIAKLADFGFSVVQKLEHEKMSIGGTRPWKAPETSGPIAVEELRHTDTFSLGLLIWSVAVGGTNPFSLILDQSDDFTIEALKSSGRLLLASHTASWIQKYLFQLVQKKFRQVLPRTNSGLRSVSSLAADTYKHDLEALQIIQLAKTMTAVQSVTHNQQAATQILRTLLESYIDQSPLLSKLDKVLSCSLGLLPSSRKLADIIEVLRPGVTPAELHITRQASDPQETKHPVTNTSNYTRSFKKSPIHIGPSAGPTVALQGDRPEQDTEAVPHSREVIRASAERGDVHPLPSTPNGQTSPLTSQTPWSPLKVDDSLQVTSWERRGYKHSYYSWQAARDLPPSMQELVYTSLQNMSDVPSRFFLASILINGHGCQRDMQTALALLRESANAGHQHSQAYLYRLHRACGATNLPEWNLLQYLDPMARIGSRAALQDMLDAGLFKEAKAAHWWLTAMLGGVGADWFVDANMLHGLKMTTWFDYDLLVATAAQIEDINQYRVNKHGDTLLHLTASCSQHKARKYLVEQKGADINCRNLVGETPLISICRAGSGGSAIVFLQNYHADASLAADNGETALHWLVSFPDETVEPLARDLVAHGAVVDAVTTARISHSVFPGTVDFDFQAPGSPLQWAVWHNRPRIVQVLLSLGANPECLSPGGYTPLKWAAGFHHTACLQLMVERLEKGSRSNGSDSKQDVRYTVVYSPLLRFAIHAADTFSMMLRHGWRYREHLHATLDFLREKTTHVNMGKRFGKTNWTAIYFAVAGGRDEVVQYLIEKRWLLEGLNEPCGELGRTPLLEAVRWNRFSLVKLLIENGADVHARACNPFNPTSIDRSALHVFADEGLKDDCGMLDYLVGLGLRVDSAGYESAKEPPPTQGTVQEDNVDGSQVELRMGETAFSCALRNNAFSVCNEFLRLGANPNATSTTAGFYSTRYPTTILGHLIVANARFTYERLKYLLSLKTILFVVEPYRKLTALHRVALGHNGISTVDSNPMDGDEFDQDTNHAIMSQLVMKFNSPEHLNVKCAIYGRTALHLAVESSNVGVVKILLEQGAKQNIRDDNGDRAIDLFGRMSMDEDSFSAEVRSKLAALLEDIEDDEEIAEIDKVEEDSPCGANSERRPKSPQTSLWFRRALELGAFLRGMWIRFIGFVGRRSSYLLFEVRQIPRIVWGRF